MTEASTSELRCFRCHETGCVEWRSDVWTGGLSSGYLLCLRCGVESKEFSFVYGHAAQGTMPPDESGAEKQAREWWAESDTLSHISIMHIQPGDVIVANYPGVLTSGAIQNVNDSIRRVFPNNTVMVLEEGMTLSLVRETKGGNS